MTLGMAEFDRRLPTGYLSLTRTLLNLQKEEQALRFYDVFAFVC